jgi:hypothetical protein
MNVEEFAEWLKTFPDQKAEIQVIEHHDRRGYDEQGGYVFEELFDPTKHTEYTDFRNNELVKPDVSYYKKSYLLIGAMNL